MKDIISGKISFDDFDASELDREKIDKAKEEIRKREYRTKQLQGVAGKGLGNYKLMCPKCHVEYLIDDIDKCTHCNRDLLTKEVSIFSTIFLEHSRIFFD